MELNYDYKTDLTEIRTGGILYVDDYDSKYPVVILETNRGKGKLFLYTYGEAQVLDFKINFGKYNITVFFGDGKTMPRNMDIIDVIDPEEWEILVKKKL